MPIKLPPKKVDNHGIHYHIRSSFDGGNYTKFVGLLSLEMNERLIITHFACVYNLCGKASLYSTHVKVHLFPGLTKDFWLGRGGGLIASK